MARTYNPTGIPLRQFLTVTVVSAGLVLTVFAVGMQTNTKQQASQATDLNTAHEITTTLNADGTMGPDTMAANFSNSLPMSYKGTLSLGITDPIEKPDKTRGKSGEKGKSQEAPGYGKSEEKKPTPKVTGKPDGEKPTTELDITSLKIVVSKAEVHLATLCQPGKLSKYPNTENKLVPSPNSNPKGDTTKLTGADKWETLNVNEELEIELMDLAKYKLTEVIGLTELACGKYTQIRLYVTKATMKLGESQEEIEVTLPGNKSIVRIVRPFNINPGQQTNLVVDFNAPKSVKKVGDTYVLKPVIARFITNK